jgi:hypothetical protein
VRERNIDIWILLSEGDELNNWKNARVENGRPHFEGGMDGSPRADPLVLDGCAVNDARPILTNLSLESLAARNNPRFAWS